jgi:uroporphyrinogen decarboxylase
MTEKENARRIIRFDRPERVVSAIPCHDISYFGVDHESFDGGGHHLPLGSRWKDIWGTEWRREHEGVMGFPRGNPLADPAALKHYTWPDPDEERLCQRVYDSAGAFDGSDKFLAGRHRDTLWEKAYMLCGMENMMTFFFTEPDFAREVLHRIMDFQLGMARHYLAAGVEFVHFGDDLGTQNGPLLGPRIVSEFLEPEYRRLFEVYWQNRVPVNFHSCGNIESVADTFMELGVSVLNPVQATANDLFALREKTRGRMALLGGVSTRIIMEGPVSRIHEEVRRRIAQLGKNGGYFCAPDQGLPFPEAHRRAFEEAVAEFGRY